MLFHNSDFSLAPVPTRCFPPRSFSRLTRLEHGFNCVPWLPEGRGGGGWKSWPLEALGRIPENSHVTKALRMESRGGEKRAWRRKYPRTEDARLRSGCASVGNDVSRAAASPCGKRARGKNTRAWKLSLSSLTRIAETFVTFVTAREEKEWEGERNSLAATFSYVSLS